MLESDPANESVDGLSVYSMLETELISEKSGVSDSVGGLRRVDCA